MEQKRDSTDAGPSHPRYRVSAVCNTDFFLRHRSYVYTGLFHLRRERHIELDLEWSSVSDGSLVILDVEDLNSSRRKKICFDIHDKSYVFNLSALETHDRYFKRSYHSADVAALPPELQSRIIPWGPIFATCSGATTFSLLSSFLRTPESRKLSPRTWRNRLGNLLDLAYLLTPHQTEKDPSAARESLILFQPRLWTDQDVTGSPTAAEINEERAELIRTLKRAFGNRFCGGLVPTPFARERYPDLLVDGNSRRRSYIRKMHQSLVGVYTEGLHHSIAWKMSEYLAAAMCIVSTPIRNTLPSPLTDENLLTFTNPDECVSACERLLSDPTLATRMQEQNYSYYHRVVEPSTNIANSLNLTFEAANLTIADR